MRRLEPGPDFRTRSAQRQGSIGSCAKRESSKCRRDFRSIRARAQSGRLRGGGSNSTDAIDELNGIRHSPLRNVLIVSPHFPPINAPDHQRVRMALPYLEEFGWKPTIVAVAPEYVEGSQDALLLESLPVNARVIRSRALSQRWVRWAGVGALSYRALAGVRRAAEDVLTGERIDLSFFSTTQFSFMNLGARWLEEFGVPYVLDFQDPWLSDYYAEHPLQRPPGGRFKYAVSRWLARRNEPRAVRGARHVVAVSGAYVEALRRRYPDVPADRFTTLPFGALEADFDLARTPAARQTGFDGGDGLEHWVYAGRGGQDMEFAVRAFFLALRRFLDESPDMESRLRIHFFGTDYAAEGRARKTVEPLALACGVSAVVSEETRRLPYFTTLRCLLEAQALFVPGSDDPGYTASKIYPYVLARKPLLAVFHRQSSVVGVLRGATAGTVVPFDSASSVESIADEIYRQWFAGWPQPIPKTDWSVFEQHSAREMTRKLCEVFDRAIETRAAGRAPGPVEVGVR